MSITELTPTGGILRTIAKRPVWMTDALDYAVSAIVIAALMAFLLGLSPNPANPDLLIGTSAGS